MARSGLRRVLFQAAGGRAHLFGGGGVALAALVVLVFVLGGAFAATKPALKIAVTPTSTTAGSSDNAFAVRSLGVAVGGANNCAFDYWCFVPASGTKAVVRKVALDDYWRDVAQSSLARQPVEESRVFVESGFAWSDFGIGIGVTFASVLTLGLVAGVLGFRLSRGAKAAEAAQ